MDRDIWSLIVQATRRLDDAARGPGRSRDYSETLIMRLYLLASWFDRPRSWVCQRDHLPRWFRPRQLPSVSQMYRRTSTPAFERSLERVKSRLAKQLPPAALLFLDGKPITISENSRDPDARDGWAVCGFAKGYKLHALVDERGFVRDSRVTPLNAAEHEVAIDMAPSVTPGARVVGDGNYDSGPLYRAIEQQDAQLLTPLRGMAESSARLKRMPASRRHVIDLWKDDPQACRQWEQQRDAIERTFGHMVTVGGGLVLPDFVRRLPRVRVWVMLKLILHNARAICRYRRKNEKDAV